MNVLILSPHADDAALSCANHINFWVKNGNAVTVLTIFNNYKCTTPTSDMEIYIHRSGFNNWREFKNARDQEDKLSLSHMGASRLSAELIDGGFREKAGKPLYSTYFSLFSGTISSNDKPTIMFLEKLLMKYEKKFDLIVVPLAVGNHVDHRITREAALHVISSQKCAFYLDIPYAFRLKHWSFSLIKKLFLSHKSFIINLTFKRKVLQHYTSQLRLLIDQNKNIFFNHKWIFFPEVILFNKIK